MSIAFGSISFVLNADLIHWSLSLIVTNERFKEFILDNL